MPLTLQAVCFATRAGDRPHQRFPSGKNALRAIDPAGSNAAKEYLAVLRRYWAGWVYRPGNRH